MSAARPILITGATGFVGAHVARAFLQRGYKVAATMRPSSTPTPLLQGSSVEWIQRATASHWIDANRPFAVVHVATTYLGALSDIVDSNILFPLVLIDRAVASGCRLFIGTDTFFGKPQMDYPHMRAYTKSKCDFNGWARLAARATEGLRIANLRLEHVYGPGDRPNKFVSQLVARLRSAESAIDLSPGDQIRDFVFVEDVADAFAVVLESRDRLVDGFTEIEVGTGQGHTLRHFASLIAETLGSRSELRFGALPHRPAEIMKSVADITWLTSAGWRPHFTIEAGIRRLLDGYSTSATTA